MIGEFLKRKRESKNIKFDSVVTTLGVNKDYVKFLEEGKIFSFGVERKKQIILAYALDEEESKEFLDMVNK